MALIGKTLFVRGEVQTLDDLTIEGRVEGQIFGEGRAIVVAPGADITGDILADDITVFGRLAGQLVATDVVDVRAEAHVTGQVIAKRFILDEAARFKGRVEPQHLEAALRVAKFQQRKRHAN
ncbi:MAG: polymer-forming cytoskeletal protein [Acidobacteria bacterium]|nr:polymer-forming cytoskeletal protein [Acidobacteriota bacterium]